MRIVKQIVQNEIQSTCSCNIIIDLDTNWIQRRDDVLKLLSLLDFYFARAVQVPLSLLPLRVRKALILLAFRYLFAPGFFGYS